MKTAFSLLLFFPFLLSAQKHKTITKHLKYGDVETYQVIKGSRIKDGSYSLRNSRSGYEISGYYKMGSKDSLWIYSSHGKMYTQGHYKNDLEEGIWLLFGGTASVEYVHGVRGHLITCYDSKGQKEQIYNDSTKSVIWVTDKWNYPSDTMQALVVNGNDTQKMRIDRPPLYFGGTITLLNMLIKNCKYPQMEKEKGVMGVVYVAMVIDTNGVIENTFLKKSVSPGLDREALRVIKLTSGKWIPAMNNGKKVKCIVIQPVRFQLQ